MRQALTGLAFVLVPGLAPEVTAARSRQREWPQPDSPPYLIATGPPALRFRGPEAPPEPEVRPVAIGPPIPGLKPGEAVVAAANLAAVQPPMSEGELKAPAAASPRSDRGPPPAKKDPPSIIPDDTRSEIRAEDFIPFFQLPGSGASGPTVGLPPSSATYTQTRK